MLGAALLAGTARAGPFDGPFSFGGDLALTSDYIYRGLSQSDGNPAVQGDLHASDGGVFAGVWASTRNPDLIPYANYDLEIYLGKRFDFGSEWSGSVSARSHYYINASGIPDDYQEISASIAWLDRWTFSVSAIPNAVRWYGYQRLGRAPAWVAETSAQWLIYGGLFVTGGAGYYYTSGVGGAPPAGYVYGSAGLAYEYRQWRVELGYYFAQNEAQEIYPYPPPSRHIAGTLSWRF